MKAKNITVLIGIILLCLNTIAQPPTGKKAICDELMRLPYIFEGKLISQHSYTIENNEGQMKRYNSYLIEVTKIIKGNIKKGTINVVIPIFYPADGRLPVPPNEGLYFCAEEIIKDTSVANTNSKSLAYYCAESMTNGELKKDNNDNLIDYFPTLAEFYTYISANYNVTIENK